MARWRQQRRFARIQVIVLVRKHVLIIDRPDGPLTRLIPSLRNLGYHSVRVSTLEAGLSFCQRLSKLSLVALCADAISEDPESVVGQFKTAHPSLPIAWLGKASVFQTSRKQPDLITEDAEVLKAEAAKLLRDKFYSTELVNELIESTISVLTTFGLASRPSEPYISSNPVSLGEVNALTVFSSANLAGHLALSARESELRMAHRKVVKKTSTSERDDLEDLLGEIGNHILGKLKTAFDGPNDSFVAGFPYFIRGIGATFRHKSGNPSLVIDFRALELSLSLDRMVLGSGSRKEKVAAMAAGKLNFL